jgi:predicted transposase YbfD/YdcC
MPRNPNKINYSKDLPQSFHSFQIIEDPRTGGSKRHHFGAVLFMVVTGVLCGMNSFSDIEEFCLLQKSWFKKWIKMPNGVPRAQTFSNIFALIDPKHFRDCLIAHIGTLHPRLQQLIAIDGKTLRGSRGLDSEASHVVSAWAADSGVTLAQEFVSEKSNEITAIPLLLEMLDLEGQIVSIDAIGTQTTIALAIIEQKADYILALKGNQGNLHKEAQDQFHYAVRNLDLTQTEGWSQHQSVEKSHGRIVERRTIVNHRLDWMSQEIRGKWPQLNSLIMVESRSSKLDDTKETREVRYYISSLKSSAAEQQRNIRQHWSIENSCHPPTSRLRRTGWVLDTAFREDHNQTYQGNAAENLSTVRRIVMNLLQIDKTYPKSTPKKRMRALIDKKYREHLLSLA